MLARPGYRSREVHDPKVLPMEMAFPASDVVASPLRRLVPEKGPAMRMLRGGSYPGREPGPAPPPEASSQRVEW